MPASFPLRRNILGVTHFFLLFSALLCLCSVRRSQGLIRATKVVYCWPMSPRPLIYSFIHFPSLLFRVPSLFLWKVHLKYRTYVLESLSLGLLLGDHELREYIDAVNCQLPAGQPSFITWTEEGCALTCLLSIWYFYPTPCQPEKKIWLTCLKHRHYMKGCLDSVYT